MLLKTSYKMKPPPSVRLKPGHPLADKLIAAWLFNEASGDKAFDSSGRRHTGTFWYGVAWTTGKFGRAVDLEGTDDYIEVADHADFTPALTPFSLAALVYMHDATNFRIASKGSPGTTGEWILFTVSNDKLYFYLWDESVNARIGRVYNTALTGFENTWLHVVMTYDGGVSAAGIKLYLNNVRVDDTDYSDGTFVAVENLAAALWFGRYDSSYSNGLFDHVMMWRRVLTPSDIAKLYARPFCMFDKIGQPQLCAAGAMR